jgi:hypothetical protein
MDAIERMDICPGNVISHKHGTGHIFTGQRAMDNDTDIEYRQQLLAPSADPPLAAPGIDSGQDDASNKEAIQGVYGQTSAAENAGYFSGVSVAQVYPGYLKKCAA